MSLSDFKAKQLSWWCERHLSVQDPKGGPPLDLIWTPLQRETIKRSRAMRLEPAWDVAVKGRQTRMSTLQLCWAKGLLVNQPGISIVWINQDEDLAPVLREKWNVIAASAVDSAGSGHPGTSIDNAHIYKLKNGSRLRWIMSGATPEKAAKAGRADTVQYAVLNEMAYWPYAAQTLTTLVPSMEHSGISVFVDSTPPEFEGMGQDYLDLAEDLRSGDRDGELLFFPWFIEPAYRSTAPAQPPYLEEELDLIEAHDLTLHQIQWRREKKKDRYIGSKFPKIFPEDLDEALAPKGAKAFSDTVINNLRRINRLNLWPKPLPPERIHAALPLELRSSTPGADLLLKHDFVKIWEAPLILKPEVRVRQLTEKEQHSARHRAHRMARRIAQRAAHAATRKSGYILAVDPAEGKRDHSLEEVKKSKKRNWQVGTLLDPEGEIAARVRTRIKPILFASLLIRLAIWAQAEIVIEDTNNARLLEAYLRERQDEEEIKRQGAHPALCRPYSNVHLHPANRSTRPAVEEAFLAYFGGLVTPKEKQVLKEMLAWDPELGKEGNTEDDCLDSGGIGWAYREGQMRKKAKKRKRSRTGLIRGPKKTYI